MVHMRRLGAAALAILVLVGAGCSESGSPSDDGGRGNIAGQVINPLNGDAGVGGITVRVQSTLGGTHSTSTNLAGGFLFVGIETGTWTVSIDVPGGMQLAASETGTRTVTLERGQTANTQPIQVVQVAQQVGSIAGRVTAGTGGVAGAAIVLEDDSPSPPTTMSDASGNFGFSGLPVGIYSLRITPPAGYQLANGQTAQRTVSVQAAQATTVNWSLVSAAVVGGGLLP